MKSYHKYYKIKASPEDVYNALVKPFAIALWTGAPAQMTEEAGTEFSLWDGDISGINLEFVKDEKIVQEWFFGDQEEKSIVTINLKQDKLYTNIELSHTNIPDSDLESLKDGWDNYYFGALKEFFQG
ncbi:MAG: SRPBCC domain-containing protein [Bacteroidales bacterium]|nr:SRPBCC domain-containing protein [Bacteroidales bacterium]MCF8405955.1 SRPBCC domain-containing protein [Bacteroidales bacterium]